MLEEIAGILLDGETMSSGSTPNVASVTKAVQEIKAGKVEFRNDNTGIVHAIVGKMSFDETQIRENTETFINYVLGLKPGSVKGQYVKSVAICATMSPSVRVAV